MENRSRRLSTNSCQDYVVCHQKTNQGCHSLSKSSSALTSSDQGDSQKTRQNIHKSLKNVLRTSECKETNSIQSSNSTEWPLIQDEDLNLFLEHTNYSHLAIDHTNEKPKHMNHLAVDSSVEPRDEGGTVSFVRSNVSENHSLLGTSETKEYEVQNVDRLGIQGTGVQKSYSDFFGCSRSPLTSPFMTHNRNSATYSVLCSSSSFSGSFSDGISSATNDSGTACSPSNHQNDLTEVMNSVRDENIPKGHLNNSTIQHNITVYAVSGTYEHGVLGPKNSGNGFPQNTHLFSQSHYNIPGVMSCDNISDIRHSPPPMIIHNSCTLHCCKGHEPMMKVDDTIAAYCHAMPISSVQFSSGLDCSVTESGIGPPPQHFYSLLPPPITFPKLVSSVSESGLDAKKLIKCGRLAFPAAPVSFGELQLHSSSAQGSNELLIINNSERSSDNLQTIDSSTKMKDTWTMTSMNCLAMGPKFTLDFRDAEVQTVIIMENKSVSTSPRFQNSGHSHLFPDVGIPLNLQCPKSPVREVRWDEEGMTWEVYGAAVDPEVLGLAIQKHLEIQIEQNLQSNELSEEHPVKLSPKEKRRSLRNVIHSLRQSNCCVRTNSTSE
ncbi:G protein-regulated inducer of neurite outgrowth 2 [Pelobates fuscus]|uniref:G protein-regulated inducer of neurite outgrowth 2 n=1 Tax=Pelobates fuscus TaxID=191477 RepID=UPI002FE4B56A